MIDKIKKLFDQKSQLVDSNENKRRLAMWVPDFEPDEYSPGQLSSLHPDKRNEKRVPVTADWDRMQWARLLDFSIKDYYTDPVSYLYWTSKIDIYRFNNFPDDTPLRRTVPIYIGVALEPSLFGVPVIYSENHEPFFTNEGAMIKERSDLVKLKIPDFYNSGIMPLAHKFYEEISKIVPKEYSVIFPKWGRSPWGTACGIRSMENLLADTIEDPQFIHSLMRLITDARKEYTKNRRKFLNKVDDESACYNDECSPPIQSPKSYETFCFPYENELCEFYGGLRWWHSCGNKTLLLDAINKFSKPIGLIDFVIQHDDLRDVVRKLNRKIPFSIRPTANDINERNEVVIRNNVQGLLSIVGEANYYFRIDEYEPNNPTEEDVDTIRRYLTNLKIVADEYVG